MTLLIPRADLAGDVTVRFVVGPTGSVVSSAVTVTTLANADVEQCLVQVTRRLTFVPQGNASATVEQRWTFSKRD